MRLKVLLLAAAAGLSPSLALAQTAAPQPTAKPADPPTAVGSVTVTSDATALRTAIDRRSDSFKDVQVIDTPALRERVERTASVRAMFVGFTYSFGGGRAKDPGFDFGGGATPGG